MKIAITADWQFDLYRKLSTILADGVSSRLSDQIDALRWAVKVAKEHGCEMFVMLGDIFDSRTEVDVSVIDRVCRFLYEEFPDDMILVIVVGNHDSYLRSPRINSLQMFKGVADVIEAPETYDADGVALNFIPWMEDREELENALMDVSRRGGYLFGHCLVEGAVPAGKGLPPAMLRPTKFKRVLLGDVHEPINIGKNIHYVSAPMQLNYGDAGGWRGMAVLDTKTDKFTRIENTESPRFHVLEDVPTKDEIEVADFVRVKSDDPEIVGEVLERVRGSGVHHVECMTVVIEDESPRIEIGAKDTEEDILRRYVTYAGLEDDALVALGMELLEEARS